jgi:hypothetical protein
MTAMFDIHVVNLDRPLSCPLASLPVWEKREQRNLFQANLSPSPREGFAGSHRIVDTTISISPFLLRSFRSNSSERTLSPFEMGREKGRWSRERERERERVRGTDNPRRSAGGISPKGWNSGRLRLQAGSPKKFSQRAHARSMGLTRA